jgi:hypothetical protein
MNIRNAKRKIFNVLSSKAILDAKNEDIEFKKIWEVSQKAFPDLENHFTSVTLDNEAILRVRYLICGEVYFLKKIIEEFTRNRKTKECKYLDIGDSDGSVRLIMNKIMNEIKIDSLGINLQTEAVNRVKATGLKAECIDAMKMGKLGRKYDIVSLFETMEHLPDPIGFLDSMHDVVGERLVISVPFIRRSRVGMQYLTDKWPKDKLPNIENTHIFELSPEDWIKIFRHTGWKVEDQWKLLQFPRRGILKYIMRYAWIKISFEGFWFVSLSKVIDKKMRKYCIE